MSLRPLGVRSKKPFGLSPRYDLTMTPYDLKVMEKLYRSGRRKRTPDLYDLQQVYKIYEAGKKRSAPRDAGDGEELLKRNGDLSRDIWHMVRMADAGKRSPVTSYYDLLDMAKLAKAGKRSGGADSYSLWHLAQMQAAGRKRAVSDYDLLSLARIADAGKRDGLRLVGPLAVDPEGEQEDEDDDDQLGTKKKRSLDDYFGWDRKKKSVGENALVDNYMNTMGKEVLGDTEKRSDSDDTEAATKKEEKGMPMCKRLEMLA